jgi:hypothetical protein
MQPYGNQSGNSGIRAFEIGADDVLVQFAGGKLYRYSAARIGREHIERMKALAQAGRGLATYISQHPAVKNGYDRE